MPSEPLRALGLSEAAESSYLDLMETGECDLAELGARRALTGPRLGLALAELEAVGLVHLRADRVVPVPPRLALEALAARRSREAALARESAEILSQMWSRGSGRRADFELLPSHEAGRRVLDGIQRDARERVRAMTLGNLSAEGSRIVDGLFDALARGVRYEVIYGAHVLRDLDALHMVQRCVEAGEKARVFAHVPMNLTIVDDRWALVAARRTADGGGRPRVAAVVVHDSPFLTGLVGFFDAFWRMAVPITSSSPGEDTASREHKQLLTYLSAGLTDEAIAREFGVSERTVARRVSRLQELLGAQTRFQLGLQAARQGWL
ncbi:helix-turn-helix domain-containing protein [Streptomyces sp. J2-1]|uniref:helix-turn-helix transcriptional regulator n=1 Tax=Streptomyces corallincola TaxID=2851888 RepID=UPI001C38AA2A|nr:LuxR C-terminal-related transcriptional regulator [Streptomyces corallincola]MBV2353901.1 helix-turn-helix domain-containing protein [Streptomyces corallincola]